jgi:hypothetical protein
MKGTIFWDITSCSQLKVNRRFGGTYRAGSACHLLARWFLAELIFSTLKMEVICSSETSVGTQRTTRRYTPEYGTIQNTFMFIALAFSVRKPENLAVMNYFSGFSKSVSTEVIGTHTSCSGDHWF